MMFASGRRGGESYWNSSRGGCFHVRVDEMSLAPSAPSLVRAGGFCWTLQPGLAPALFDDAGLRLSEWLSAGQAHIVKQGPHRVVYRVELPGLCFYLKHNRVTDARSWLRQLVRTSKARQEYASALAVAARGVPTVCPLAFGEQASLHGGESYLITRGLEGCVPLNLFLVRKLPGLEAEHRARVRQRLADELGILVARIHDSGILHNDFHTGNILVRLDADDELRLYLIDLNAVRLGPPLDFNRSIDNLVMLNSWFLLYVNRTDRLRFWRSYFTARAMGTWSRGPRACRDHLYLAAEIERRTWKFNHALWRRHDDRCVKNNRYYHRVRAPGIVGHAATELDAASLAPLLADPDEPFRRPGVRLLKHSPSSTVAELEMVVEGRLRKVIYKRFRGSSPKEMLASCFRQPPAMRSWIHGHGFRARAVPTARTLAVLHRQRCGIATDGYLLTEKIEDAQELQLQVAELLRMPRSQGAPLLHRLIDHVARVIRGLHQRQLSHRDLKAANVLVRRPNVPPPGPPHVDPIGLLHAPESSVWLIDLVGVELFRRMPHYRKIQNLARLNASFHGRGTISRAERLRFLRTYLFDGLRGSGNWKAWWRQIDRATQRKVARNLRHGRPLG
jgi:tRNA A-37 threonylcarbamoyl transferase component Bud32